MGAPRIKIDLTFKDVASRITVSTISMLELRCRYDDLSQSYTDFRPAGSLSPKSEIMPSYWQIFALAHKGWDLEDETQRLIAIVRIDQQEENG
jgi:hypothetical protein